MERNEILPVVEKAAAERGCSIVELCVDDDNNIELTIDRDGGADLADCEFVHRAVLSAFNRDIEDYALTVGSVGISPEEADRLLSESLPVAQSQPEEKAEEKPEEKAAPQAESQPEEKPEAQATPQAEAQPATQAAAQPAPKA